LKTIAKYQLILLFFGLLLIPTLNSIFHFVEFDRKDENRTFKDKLTIDPGKLDVFPEECETYINDNFSFRAPLLSAYHTLKFSVFNVSPHRNKTILGRDGWYYMAAGELEIYEGRADFTEEQLNEFKQEWKRRKAYLGELGIDCYWVIAPMKHHVYDEHLPFNVVQGSNGKRVDRLKEVLGTDFPDLIIDPAETLRSAKTGQKVFYRLDNHWNFRAGQVTSDYLLSILRKKYPEKIIPEIPKYEWRDSTFRQGIHRSVLGMEELEEIDVTPYYPKEASTREGNYGFKAPEGFAYPWEYEHRFINHSIPKGKGIRALIIRDSFGEQAMPFLKQPFEESVFIFDAWQYKLDKEIIERVKPDVIIYLGLETFLANMITDFE